jgi:hypothetical protein
LLFTDRFCLLALSGCGYHTLGAATHLPPDVKTLSVPVFATRTEAYHTETVMTQAVIREFATRTRLRVTPDASGRRRRAAWNDSQRDGGAAHLQLLDAAVVQLSDHRGGFRHAHRPGRQSALREQELRLPPAVPVHHQPASFFEESPAAVERLSRDLRGSWWPMCWKGFKGRDRD